MKYNPDRSEYDYLIIQLEELKKRQNTTTDYYEYLNISNQIYQLTKNKYYSKLLLSQIEVKRSIIYY